MLKNIEAVIPAVIMDVFNKSEYTFYLTGSRYWKCARAGSDWDFFVQSCEEVAAMLENLGFYQTGKSYVDDSQCTSVYEKWSEGGLVQVQLVVSPEKKNLIQEKLIELYPNGLGNKDDAKIIWKNAFEFFELGQKTP